MSRFMCRNIGAPDLARRPVRSGSGRNAAFVGGAGKVRAAPCSLPNLAAIALFGATTAMLPCSGAVAADTVIKRFLNGTSRDSVGMIAAREDAPMDAPQAIYAAEDGSLYLLDQVNGRLLRFDAKKADSSVQSLELPEEMRPTDVVVRRGNVYVWDGAPQALQAAGRDDEPVRDRKSVV